MKAFYYENNGYNGILLVGKDGKWISYDDVIDGIEIKKENIAKIAENFLKNDFNDNDFETTYNQQFGTLIYGDNATETLEEQEYYEEIYRN